MDKLLGFEKIQFDHILERRTYKGQAFNQQVAIKVFRFEQCSPKKKNDLPTIELVFEELNRLRFHIV
jgi:hypothetical protein